MLNSQKKTYYFDYAATTPLDERVLKAMLPFFSRDFGNPSNLYSLGQSAKAAVTQATINICRTLGCSLGEFVYTGSATEADNLALVGTYRANRKKGSKIIISNVEHKGILAAAEALAHDGVKIIELKVNKQGLVNPQELKKLLDDQTILVSCACSDSETGTIQPISNLAQVIKDFRQKNHSVLPYFHTDASQAFGYLDINVEKLGVDLMTLSAHKIYGPKGIGGLYVRKGVRINSIIFGGGQQTLRSGTENVPGIVGFGEAAKLVFANRTKESARLRQLRDKLEAGIMKRVPKVVRNGHPTKRLPNFCNVSILDVEGEALLLYLDEKGIMVSTGSACNSQSLEPSHVLKAMGHPYEYIHGSLRFTLGSQTKLAHVNYVLKKLPPIVAVLRKISPLNLIIDKKKEISMLKAFIGNQTPHFLRKKK